MFFPSRKERKVIGKKRIILLMLAIFMMSSLHVNGIYAQQLQDPLVIQQVFSRFPFAEAIPFADGESWGLIYADVYGKIHLLKSTKRGWKVEWEITNLAAKVRDFFIRDIESDGYTELIVATVDGRILIYTLDDYSNVWENLDDNFTSISAMEIENVDDDEQLEFIVIADDRIVIIDGYNKNHQWVSERQFKATEILIENVDNDDQMEIVLNTGKTIDTRFLTVELEWDKPFGERITAFDMNNDGHPEIIGEFSDYSLRIFDVHAQREVW